MEYLCSKCKYQDMWDKIWPRLPNECKSCNKGEENKEIIHPRPIGISKYQNNFKPKIS